MQIKLTRIAMRAALGRNKRAVVALVASIAGYSKQYPSPIYSATKHAVVGFTRSMGDAETLQGLKVVAICPGWVPIFPYCAATMLTRKSVQHRRDSNLDVGDTGVWKKVWDNQGNEPDQ